MSAQSSAMSTNAASKDASSIGNGVSSSGGPTPSGSQQTEWVRRTTNGVSSNASANNSTSNQSGPRRPSLSTTLTHHPRDYPSSASAAVASSGVATPLSSTAYQPPHITSRDASNPYKFSKEFMLHKFEALEANGTLSDNSKVNKLLLGESEKEGLFGGGVWGAKERNGNGTEACWDPLGQQRPVSFEAMTTEEKELFQSVNSVQKPHHTPITPGGPNSTSGGPLGQGNQPRNSTSATNLNSNYHKSNPSVSSSTGAPVPSGTASPTARNRPRRDTGEGNAFPPIGRRRTDRGEESGNLFERFVSRSQAYAQSGDDGRENDDSAAGPAGRGVFKRQPSGGAWGVSSPVTPGGSAHSAFSNGAFGGVGSFVLNSGVPVAKVEGDKKVGGSIGKAAGRSLLGDKVEEENEDADDFSRPGPKSEDAQRQAAYESSLQQLSRESEAEAGFPRDEYGRRPGSTDTDPYNPRESLQPGDLDVENPLEDKRQIPQESSYFNEPSVGTIGRNLMSSPTRNLSGGGVFGSGMGVLGSNVASPSSTQQGKHTPLSGFHHLQTQVGGGMSGSQGSEPLSPSDTNPYQSPLPEAEDGAGDEDGTGSAGIRNFRPAAGSDRSQTSSAGIIGAGLPGMGGLGGFNGPLGTPGLWSSLPPLPRDGSIGSGTPHTAGIGSGFFGPSADSSGIGTPSGAASGAFGTTRASRLGQLFPAEQQQQLQHLQEQQRQNRSMLEDDGGFDPSEAFRALAMSDKAKMDNRSSIDSMFGSASGRPSDGPSYFDAEGQPIQGPPGQIQSKSSFPVLSNQNSMSSLPQFTPGGPTPGGGAGPGSQPPSQRSSGGHIMIMPDKISWVYKDPTGKIQGPFSGLEMHDWYKAGFFQPDLLIKRQEETDFELLGQFIRRVGNSREPFLIPMQGPAFPPGGGWSAPSPWGQNTIDAANGIVQPPFPGAFPTFGTTLTAEQQNALERRKQEEQYLMARQREYLVQQQVIAKQVAAAQHMSRMSQESLHHHPSQASLHSQPSLTNIQSPGAFPTPSQPGPFGELRHTTSNPSLESFGPSREEFSGFPGPIQTPQGFRPSGSGAPQTQQTTREQAEVLERQRAQMARQYQNQQQLLERQQQQRAQLLQQAMGTQGQQQIGSQGLVQGQQAGVQRDMPPYQVAAGDDAIDITQDVGFDNDTRPDMTGTALADEYELFQQQHQLQLQQHEESFRKQFESGQGLPYFPGGDVDFSAIHPQGLTFQLDNEFNATIHSTNITSVSAGPGPQQQQPGTYTDEASTNEPSVANESLNNHDDDEEILSEHPTLSPLPTHSATIPELPKNPWGVVPQSAMPLPFPAPKSVTSPRPSTAQSVPKSPSVGNAEVPSVPVAPWAKDLETAPHTKGPSLKEIQENQAKQVAKAEAAALEARRQEQAQQAVIAAATVSTTPTSGLPSTSTWAAPAPAPVNTASVWAKPLTKVATGPVSKKTLAQIQKEEEARKQKAIAQAAAQTPTPASATPTPASAARRSEWASKAAAAPQGQSPSSNLTGGAWTTVGAGGKKVGGPASVASPPPQARPTLVAPAAKVAKKPATSAATSIPPAQKSASDEFTKWCKINLKGLNQGVNVDDFLNMIMSFPLEVDLISDSVYQQSTTIDGRRFAEEFIRRRKLAQQGVIVDHGHHGDEAKSSGGWNEVAKKGRDTIATGTSAAPGATAAGDASMGNGSFKVVQGKKKRK